MDSLFSGPSFITPNVSFMRSISEGLKSSVDQMGATGTTTTTKSKGKSTQTDTGKSDISNAIANLGSIPGRVEDSTGAALKALNDIFQPATRYNGAEGASAMTDAMASALYGSGTMEQPEKKSFLDGLGSGVSDAIDGIAKVLSTL